MSTSRPIEIIGGGLAGLALGAALCRAKVPVELNEAAHYPRHRVCGEFIAGLDPQTICLLGLTPVLENARVRTTIDWFACGRRLGREKLPEPALAISRYELDARLASAFVAAGGKLLTGSRVDLHDSPPGRVFCTGRARSSSAWLGLKCHFRDVGLVSDLEFHLGRGAYVGLCAVEDASVNVCALFRKRPGLTGSRHTLLAAYLRAARLDALADRIEHALPVEGSWCSVAGISFSGAACGRRIQLGDAHAVIAPFTGNGMASAFQSAAEALAPLVEWSGGAHDWAAATQLVHSRLRHRFRRRLRAATWLHPFLFTTAGQRCFQLARRAGLAPLGPWYRLLH
jgi:2-polyprenyl-6-methoxyphenol hydroxylase-like FAD-dependent oxidoreductase